jgi:hypothetical protein
LLLELKQKPSANAATASTNTSFCVRYGVAVPFLWGISWSRIRNYRHQQQQQQQHTQQQQQLDSRWLQKLIACFTMAS